MPGTRSGYAPSVASKPKPICQMKVPCQTDLPKPNQLCPGCRPHWAKSKVKPRKG